MCTSDSLVSATGSHLSSVGAASALPASPFAIAPVPDDPPVRTLRSTLRLLPAWAAADRASAQELAAATPLFKVCLVIDRDLLGRLDTLHHLLRSAQADEVSDWRVQCPCAVSTLVDTEAPPILGVGATVHASGEVQLSVVLQGLDSALYLAEPLDLHQLVREAFLTAVFG